MQVKKTKLTLPRHFWIKIRPL